MVFSSRYQIDIPAVDLLTYVFGTSAPTPDSSIFVNAERHEQTICKSELESLVKKLAGGLRTIVNAEKEDVILMFTENSVWYPAIVLGVICAGCIFTGANPGYTASELTHQLNVSGAKCIFTDSQRLERAILAANAVGIPRSSIILIDDGVQSTTDGIQNIKDLLSHGMYHWKILNDVEELSQKTAVLNFSSGTTGNPKACMITHRNLVANSEQTLHLDHMASMRESDPKSTTQAVHCAYVPFYHAIGLLTYCVVNIRRCCTTVIMRKFDLELLLSNIQRFRVTDLLLVPPVVVMLVKSHLLSRYDVSSVKTLLCGAAPLQPELSAQLETIFSAGKAHSRQGWGMSEATMAVSLFAPDEFDPSHQSVGYIVPNVQIKIINDEGHEVGYDEEGEALVQGPNVFKGYYKNPAATKEAWTEDGWLKTGDIVTIQRNGLLSIVDRKKELIKVKGFQVAPSELEGHLLQHPGVKDCAVIRVNRDGQEHPQAHIVRTGEDVTTQSILTFMDNRLSAYKRLTGGIVFRDTIPKSSSGKILRRMLKDEHKARNSHL